jgi:hypothetical protein
MGVLGVEFEVEFFVEFGDGFEFFLSDSEHGVELVLTSFFVKFGVLLPEIQIWRLGKYCGRPGCGGTRVGLTLRGFLPGRRIEQSGGFDSEMLFFVGRVDLLIFGGMARKHDSAVD